jgi:carbonic anhydrase
MHHPDICHSQDGIFISRNPGGRVTPAMPDIMALDGFLDLANIVVIHHTGKFAPAESNSRMLTSIADCGATHFTDEGIRKVHKDRLPNHPEIDAMIFGAFGE